MEDVKNLTLQRTMQLSTINQVHLWNAFVEESGLVGEDSYIYDLENKKDIAYLIKYKDEDKVMELINSIKNGDRFVQWVHFAKKPNKVCAADLIKFYWYEMFEKIMCYPSAYNFDVHIFSESDMTKYFDDVFFPIIALGVGYKINVYKSEIEDYE